MAIEVLSIPERFLPEVIDIIRQGILSRRANGGVTPEVEEGLEGWCQNIEEQEED